MNERSEEIQHPPSSNASGCYHGGEQRTAVTARYHELIIVKLPSPYCTICSWLTVFTRRGDKVFCARCGGVVQDDAINDTA